MQSKINEVVKSNSVKYPCLKKWTHPKDSSCYVISIFTSENICINVFKSESSNASLFTSEFYHEAAFEVFNGEDILSN